MDDPGGCLGWALLPLRRYAEFRGRSRRTELVAFYLWVMLLGVALTFGWLALRTSGIAVLFWAVPIALLCPTLALAVRRLHDSGRSGWWLLLAVPGLALDIWQGLYPAAALDPQAAAALAGLSELAGLGLLVLLLWKDDPDPNRYGPNPRFDPPGSPQAQDLA